MGTDSASGSVSVCHDELECAWCHELIAVDVLIKRHFHIAIELELADVELQTGRCQKTRIAAVVRFGFRPTVSKAIGCDHPISF